jgi:hypothetical protein
LVLQELGKKEMLITINNERAAAAFRKGLNDLEEAWPAIEAKCAESDAAYKEFEEKKAAEYDADMAAYATVELNRAAWARSTSWFKGPAPASCMPPSSPSHWMLRHAPAIWRYMNTKYELQRQFNLASAAVGDMTIHEDFANAMVEWENGTAIERILKGLAS